MKKNQGFTLVELVIVIVILGILAITAAPKFFNLAGDAKAGTLNAVKASLQSANAVIYSKAVLAGEQKKETGTVTDAGTTINLVYGYVKAADTDVKAVLDIQASDFIVETAVENTALKMKATDVMVYPAGTTKPTVDTKAEEACVLVYSAAASATAKPIYTATTTGC
jgi:MSHA pilin protein MshA